MVKVYEVSIKYIMLFTHNNRYLPLTGLLTLFIQPAPISPSSVNKSVLKQANQVSRPAHRLRELQYA